MKRPKSIVIVGRRWFDRTHGNTYYSAKILVDGTCVDFIEYAYGYGDQYVQDSTERLEDLGYLPNRETHPNLTKEMLWQYCAKKGIKYYFTVSDVGRKKDL